MIVVGAGGFALEVIDICHALGKEIDCFVVDRGYGAGRLGGAPVREHNLNWYNYRGDIVYAIGNPMVRQKMVDLFPLASAINLIHPAAIVSVGAKIGRGVIVCAGAQITRSATIGNYVLINMACTVGHGASVGDFSTLSPGSRISGNVSLGRRSFCGSGAVVIPGISVGDNAVIGAGSSVMRNVPDGCTVLGVPARILSTEEDVRVE